MDNIYCINWHFNHSVDEQVHHFCEGRIVLGVAMLNKHDWLTLHRVRFSEVIDGRGNPMPPPTNAEFFRFSPESPIQGDGLRGSEGDTWGGFALYKSKEDAEAVFNDPQAHLPFLDRAVEAWHALVVPYAHRGGVQWRDTLEQDSAITVAPSDPKGPLIVLTTAGYTDPGPEDVGRIKEFNTGIDKVLEYYGTLPGNLRHALFSGGAVDGREGCTMTLWRDDMTMMGAAYKSGGHKEQLDQHNRAAMFDHSSFTRGRVMASKGTWAGNNPIDEISG